MASRGMRECERQRQAECQKRHDAVTVVEKSADRVPKKKPCTVPVPYSCSVMVPIKRSMSFLSAQELFSYKALPAFGIVAYLGTGIGTLAHRETFRMWLGSDYRAINVMNGLTIVSVLGTACYMYGKKHIRQAGAFQKMVYPLFGSLAFNTSSHFCWAFLKELFREQYCFDHHWRCLAGVMSGLLLLYTGRSYLNYVDYW